MGLCTVDDIVVGISTPDRWSVDGCMSVYRVVRVFGELNDVGYE